ncbi:fasciclin domain-containing protein [Kordia sp. YSTF-M3]|uniref:Fasciclin domain-containing protein n=1 Tax=Kordia aestuariivivens TaxID=2759037 RepID=A0ABR7Q945_9FLAO|nr:fasciclin domain-containing protein [Kordia aestuariivivens]MBC8754881.1 fasciclin domain-containing protein [Kordia aestuariivivens]
MKKLILTITTAALFLFTANVNAQNQDVVDVAASNDSFSTLVTAVKAAGLVEALKGEGPFTVFAPTNDAFAKIDAATLGSLLKPENKSKLTSILTYHVIQGKLTAKDVVAALKAGKGKVTLTTLSGAEITVVQNDKGIWLKDANGNYSMISSTDVMASNGVIHVIDSVVMPK